MKRKSFSVWVVLLLLMALGTAMGTAVVPASPVQAIGGATIEVSQPVQITNDSHYERGQSIVYGGGYYYLFYGRSASCTQPYGDGNPDINDYVVYYKKATSVAGLAAATPTLISGVAHNVNGYMGETGAAYFGGEIWAFATVDVGSAADLYGWWTANGGTTWNEVGPIITGLSDGQAHHDEIAFGGELWVIEGSGDYTTKHSATPKTGGWSAPLAIGALTGGLAHFFVDGSNLYLAINSNTMNYIYKYNSTTVAWDLVDSNAPPNKYDPTLFRVGSSYVFAQAPWDGTKQYILAWSGTTLNSTFFDTTSKMITEGAYGSNPWVDMWPIGFSDQSGNSYLFFTSERNPANAASEIVGNVWYLPVTWPVTNNHYTYIQEAVNASSSGDTIDVAAGTYAEEITISKANLTLRSESALGAIIRPTTTPTNNGAAIYISADGVTVDGFEIDGTTVCKNGIYGWETSGLTIKNNKIHGAINAWDGCGILLISWGNSGTVYNNRIQGNVVYDTGRMGIMVMDHGANYTVTSGNTITGNTVYDVWKKATAWDDGGGGIQINVGKNCSITNNKVYNVQDGQRGIYMFGSAAGNTITGNTLRDNPIGIQLWISGEGGDTIVWGSDTPASPQVRFNNIYNNGNYGAKSTNIAGTPMIMDATNNWWGANDGPDDDDGIINGSGNKVSTNVDADPWIRFTLVANPTEIVANGTSQSDLTAKLKNSDDTIVAPDAQLNQLPGFAKVTFTTDKGVVGSLEITKNLTDGQATAKLTSSTTVEAAHLTAQAKDASDNAISGATGSASVNFIAGASSTVTATASPASIVANGTSTSTITATVKDQYGHTVADGTSVVFTTDKGSIGSLTTTKTTTNGVATATLTSSINPEVADITATANGVSATTAVIFTKASAPVTQSNTQTVSGSGTVTTTSTGGDVTIDGTGDHTLTTAKYSGNPGGTPSFQASGNYYDVHLDSSAGVNGLTVQFCPATAETIIYYWNGSAWVAASNQQYANGCVTVTITPSTRPNLSDLTGLVFGSGTLTPTPTPAPALHREQAEGSSYGDSHSITLRSPNMKVRYLKITPQQAYTNQPVTISTNVINDGGDGSYNVMLRINNRVEETKTVSVSGGTVKQVNFTVAKSQPGTYAVQVGNEKSMFTVIAGDRVSENAPTNEGVIVLVLFGALLLATVVVLLIAFRRPAQ